MNKQKCWPTPLKLIHSIHNNMSIWPKTWKSLEWWNFWLNHLAANNLCDLHSLIWYMQTLGNHTFSVQLKWLLSASLNQITHHFSDSARPTYYQSVLFIITNMSIRCQMLMLTAVLIVLQLLSSAWCALYVNHTDSFIMFLCPLHNPLHKKNPLHFPLDPSVSDINHAPVPLT